MVTVDSDDVAWVQQIVTARIRKRYLIRAEWHQIAQKLKSKVEISDWSTLFEVSIHIESESMTMDLHMKVGKKRIPFFF